MDFILKFVDFFIHLDHHLSTLTQEYGAWTYLILFLIIFCETGLVFTPFLPGDSLLFAVGALAAMSSLEIKLVLILLSIAAILGDTVNYWIGKLLAPKVFQNEKIPFLKREHLERTQQFYEKYGGKTIIIARFIPIIRTFAPFLAGVGTMNYFRFLLYNVIGGVCWINFFTLGGYFFGNIPVIKRNFTLVIFAIIFISILPGIIEYLRHQVSIKSRKPIL